MFQLELNIYDQEQQEEKKEKEVFELYLFRKNQKKNKEYVSVYSFISIIIITMQNIFMWIANIILNILYCIKANIYNGSKMIKYYKTTQ